MQGCIYRGQISPCSSCARLRDWEETGNWSRRTSRSKLQHAYLWLPSSCGTPVSLLLQAAWLGAACA